VKTFADRQRLAAYHNKHRTLLTSFPVVLVVSTSMTLNDLV